jgi:hypothetical protein
MVLRIKAVPVNAAFVLECGKSMEEGFKMCVQPREILDRFIVQCSLNSIDLNSFDLNHF